MKLVANTKEAKAEIGEHIIEFTIQSAVPEFISRFTIPTADLTALRVIVKRAEKELEMYKWREKKRQQGLS